MITFIKAKPKKSDRLTNIDEYRVPAHKIPNNIISYTFYIVLHYELKYIFTLLDMYLDML